MDVDVAARLIEINRDFYTRFGDSFSATRHRLQPGVRRILDNLTGDESILDLGCGNGELARALGKQGHRGPYLGLDFSLPLLHEAEILPEESSARFIEVDLTKLSVTGDQWSVIRDQLSVAEGWSLITAFAVLHHIPSNAIRLEILNVVHRLLAGGGKFILSNWQFLNSEKLRSRVQDWSKVGLTDADVDPGDYLLDWRSGGEGLRYVHHFSAEQLASLAGASGFTVRETFSSDGESGNLSLSQIWEIDPTR